MRKLSQMRGSLTQTVLIYGPPKVGKTQLAGELATHPEVAGIIWVDLENGIETLMKLPPEAQEKISVIQLPDTRSNPVGIETCLKLVRGTKVSICEEHGIAGCMTCRKAGAPIHDYELGALPPNWVVVFDSLTQLTDSGISYITKGKPDDYKLQFDDWGDLGKLMSVFLSHIQQAKFNVICISHEVEAEREDGTVRVVPVAGSRAFSRNTAKYFGHCIYAEVKAKKHVFTSSTTGTSNVVAGSRADIKLELIKDGNASLFPIFEAAMKSTAEAGKVIPKEIPKEIANASTATITAAEALGTDVSAPENTAEVSAANSSEEKSAASNAEIHAAAMAGMSAIERIRYKKANGL